MADARIEETLRSHYKFFDTISSQLKKKTWFKKNSWIARSHYFPSKNPDGVTFHVFKKHWFNEDTQGIHFESYRDARSGKDREVYVTLHILHHSLIPGSRLKRKALAKPFIDRVEIKVRTWDHYSFRAGKYGLQFFTTKFRSNEPGLTEKLVNEFERLCTELGPIMDEVLKGISS